jgi:hypothetical protein
MTETGNHKKALVWGKFNYPDSPEAHHQAFASLVVFAVEKPTRRYKVIDTMRTYVGLNKILAIAQPGCLSFDGAVTLLETDCYGPITGEHADVYKQCRFKEDYSADVDAAQAILANSQPIPLSKQFLDRETD